MSGRRHHYLPRFLQRPFAFRQSGKHFYVYAHHRAYGAYATNVTELGQELDFYGGPEDTSLDDAITEGEKQLAVTVHRLNNGESVPKEDIATLFSALSIRTKTMRKSLSDLLPALLEAGRTRLLDDNELRAQLRKSLHDPRERKRLIYEQIRKNMGPQSREQQAQIYSKLLPAWQSFVANQEEALVIEMKRIVRVGLDYAIQEANSIADDAFLKALTKGPEMPIRAKRLVDEMHFEIWDALADEFFVLSDSGPVAMFTDAVPRLALGAIDNDVEMDLAFLPISPTRCVVARRPSTQQSLDVRGLNRISAALSHEFVVSHEKDDEHLTDLRQSISSMTPIATEESLFRILNDDDKR